MSECSVESDSSSLTEEASMRRSVSTDTDSEAETRDCHECPEADAMREGHVLPVPAPAETPIRETIVAKGVTTSVPCSSGAPLRKRRSGVVKFDPSVVNNSGSGEWPRAVPVPRQNPRPRLHSSSSRPSLVDKLRDMNLSFAGCGFLGVYHIGVAACVKRYCPELLKRRISGASAGAIAAAALICETSLSTVMSDLVRIAREIQSSAGGSFNPFVSVPEMLRSGLEKNLPPNAHELCSGRLHVSVTRLRDSKNCILSQFETREELINALMCTAFIPVFSGWSPPRFRGERYMDGCYSNNLPTLDSHTLTVSPFCGEADICPRDRNMNLVVVNVANTPVEVTQENMMRTFMIMHPPSPEVLSELANQGFNDAVQFMMRHDLIKCQVCVLNTEIVGRAYSSCGQLITHEQNCDNCNTKRQLAQFDRLPDNVHEPLSENIIMSRRSKALRNWVLDFPGVRHVVVLALPWAITYKIIRDLYRRMVRKLPALMHLLEDMASEVVRVIHRGLWNHLKERRRQRLHARYTCRVNVYEYGESAGVDGHEESEASQAQAEHEGGARYVPGFVRSYDRQFRVDFTQQGHATVVRTTSDAERLENQVILAGTDGAGPGVQVVEPAAETEDQNFDRDVIKMAMLETQADAAGSGVSWYYQDKEGNVRINHLSAIQTPVVTPTVSRRTSMSDELPTVPRKPSGEDPLTQALLRSGAARRSAAPAHEEPPTELLADVAECIRYGVSRLALEWELISADLDRWYYERKAEQARKMNRK